MRSRTGHWECWHFALMLQLYAVWRLLLCGRRWTWGVVLAVGCTAVQMLCQSDGHVLAWLRYNCVGNILPFVAGWLAARHLRCVRWPWLVAAVAFALTVLCQFHFYAWCLAPLTVCMWQSESPMMCSPSKTRPSAVTPLSLTSCRPRTGILPQIQ